MMAHNICGITVIIRNDQNDVGEELSQQVQDIANESIEKNGVFRIGLSGGSLIKLISASMPNIQTDWSKWFVFFCDESILPEEFQMFTTNAHLTEIFKDLIPEENIVKPGMEMTAAEAAKDYGLKLKLHFPESEFPRFHCLLLGIGTDGHTCSLFPNHETLNKASGSDWVLPITNSSKPPPNRITLTFSVINNAENCVFTAYGFEKQTILKEVFSGMDLPATRVKPSNGRVIWILDKFVSCLL